EFAPHPKAYYETIISFIRQQLHSAEKA
ncbi:NUDIX hydrolase, partial [Priestia megaterium]